MPFKLLPQRRFFNFTFPVTHFPTMKCNSTLKPKPVPVLSRMFPHKLKYRSIGFPILPTQQQELRRFSSRSGRSRPGSGSGHEMRVSKSLIEDEAELSDWVSGLRSDSFKKTQVYSDSNDNDGGRGKFGNMRGGGEERGEKRRRDVDFDDFNGPGRRNGGRFGSELDSGRSGGRGQTQSNSRNGGRFGNDRGSRSDGRGSGGRDRMASSPRGGRFGSDMGSGSEGRRSGGRDRMDSSPGKGGRFGSDAGSGSEGRRSGGRDRMEATPRKGGRFGSDIRSVSEGRRSGGRDRMESSSRKGGRFGSEMAGPSDSKRGTGRVGSGYGRDMGGQAGSDRLWRKEETSVGRGSSTLLDEDDTDNEDEDEGEEEEESGFKGFRDLIDSEEESEESDEDDEVEDGKMSSLEKEDIPRAPRPHSTGKSDSHLTETR